ncbi:mannose-6-phosphate isomerase, class I [Rhodococcus sp. X156]|uniref:mannose-6-phosphate isomerase, class I n=1 Tax=Rhodococcus sp. X156 TaxID=2499145 RepID=UPI000FDB646C|nr:mannose-6-phosphate isomerase, class I [Rhodococcus sp. X156]
MHELLGVVRHYAWGSRTALAELTGRPAPAPHPEAELWLGAHPADPATVRRADGQELSLLAAIEAEPEVQLGAACCARFGGTLPFLFKVLAADEPLSLQAHPSAEQAREGYEREEQRRVPQGSQERNYRDPSHKPELLCALTTFHALAGFRRVDRTIELLTAMRCPELDTYLGLLAGQPDSHGLRAVLTTWITLPVQVLESLLPAVLSSLTKLVAEDGDFVLEAQTTLELGERYPGDAGVLASLLLNRVVLKPGEAIYLPAGNLHAYLSGVGVEVMANSDNVLRGGLTPKHVDVPELLRVLDFAHGDMPVLSGTPWSGGPASQGAAELGYPTPTEEFALSRVELPAGDRLTLGRGSPQVLLCTVGQARLSTADGAELTVDKGGSVWLPATGAAVSVVAGDDGAQLFRVRDGLTTDEAPTGA